MALRIASSSVGAETTCCPCSCGGAWCGRESSLSKQKRSSNWSCANDLRQKAMSSEAPLDPGAFISPSLPEVTSRSCLRARRSAASARTSAAIARCVGAACARSWLMRARSRWREKARSRSTFAFAFSMPACTAASSSAWKFAFAMPRCTAASSSAWKFAFSIPVCIAASSSAWKPARAILRVAAASSVRIATSIARCSYDGIEATSDLCAFAERSSSMTERSARSSPASNPLEYAARSAS
mmetsp:Transcript_15238/g.36858  ORF Transcript_15238/g.36858 Transcript_15238/m.36858 type:complete len:241 (+) Transcript_15238:253-975(+)